MGSCNTTNNRSDTETCLTIQELPFRADALCLPSLFKLEILSKHIGQVKVNHNHIEEANRYFASGNNTDAIRHYAIATQIDPASADFACLSIWLAQRRIARHVMLSSENKVGIASTNARIGQDANTIRLFVRNACSDELTYFPSNGEDPTKLSKAGFPQEADWYKSTSREHIGLVEMVARNQLSQLHLMQNTIESMRLAIAYKLIWGTEIYLWPSFFSVGSSAFSKDQLSKYFRLSAPMAPVEAFSYKNDSRPALPLLDTEGQPYRSSPTISQVTKIYDQALQDLSIGTEAMGLFQRLLCLQDGEASRQRQAETTNNRPALKTFDTSLISIVVATSHDPEIANRCLQSIVATTEHHAIELIVVSDKPHYAYDAFTSVPESNQRRIRIISERNLLTHFDKYQRGVIECSGAICILMESCVEMRPGWLPPLMGALSRSKIAAVQPTVVDNHRRVASMGAVFSDTSDRRQVLHKGLQLSAQSLKGGRPLQALAGPCIAFRSEDFESVDGFSSEFSGAYFETDLSLQLARRVGGFCWCSYDSIIVTMRPAFTLQDFDFPHRFDRFFRRRWGLEITQDALLQQAVDKVLYTEAWAANIMLDGPPEFSDDIFKVDQYIATQTNRLSLLDAKWYSSTYGLPTFRDDEAALWHYINIGVLFSLNPSTNFDLDYYTRANPDIVLAGVNPFIHYATQGHLEGRAPKPAQLRAISQLQKEADSAYVPYRELEPLKSSDIPATLICFYLPQFHTIPENNEWWGDGFTEWTNVRPAAPLFPGHYQPHVPDSLGYYDLLDRDIPRKQISLAKNYGIGGFCFYYYWFGGKRLLEKPVEAYLGDPSLDFPYCLCWANENWSRRWDGLDSEILISQNHSPEDDIAFIKSISQHFRDSRYIRVAGKPLLIVYRPSLLPDAKATVARWRKWCVENGIGEIFLVLTHAFDNIDPRSLGFDAAVEFPPNNTFPPDITDAIDTAPEFSGKIYDWIALAERSNVYVSAPYPVFRGVNPSWDNTARKKERATILYGSSPRLYQNWLRNAIVDSATSWGRADRLVFINAWNEWAEGAHLEPDAKYGHAYLESTRLALNRANLELSPGALYANDILAVVVHCFYPDVLMEIMEHLPRKEQVELKLFVTCPPELERDTEAVLRKYSFDYFLHTTENRGRDVLPFFKILPYVFNGMHRCILKLHTKRSQHRNDGDTWRNDLYRQLTDLPTMTETINRFRCDDSIGLVSPAGHDLPMDCYWGSNERTVLSIAARLGVDASATVQLPFVAGTMFYCRTTAIQLLSTLVHETDFESEAGQTDGTFAHAIERSFSVLMHSLNLKMLDTQFNELQPNLEKKYKFAAKG